MIADRLTHNVPLGGVNRNSLVCSPAGTATPRIRKFARSSSAGAPSTVTCQSGCHRSLSSSTPGAADFVFSTTCFGA